MAIALLQNQKPLIMSINLKAKTAATSYQIIHLATHADFPNKRSGVFHIT